jgi:hypothetical protein
MVVAVLAVLVAVCTAYRLLRVRRALVAERASRRLVEGMHARDLDAFHRRITALLEDRAVLAEAELVLDSALAAHRTEGGPA